MAKKKLKDYVGESVQVIEENASNAPVKDINWEAQQIESEKIEIKDPGVGTPVILRTFEYQFNPNLPKDIKITKQAIFDSHKEQIRIMLWGDGMTVLDNPDKKPKVQISKKQNKYRIFVMCMPNQTLIDKPTTI